MREKMQDVSQEERREKMQAIMKEINASAMKSAHEFLKADQIHRLKQISYPDARNPGVQRSRGRQKAEPHGLSEERHPDDFRRDDDRAARSSVRAGPERRRAGRHMKKRAEINKGTLGKVAAKLNDEQQKTWKELIGSPFDDQDEPPAGQLRSIGVTARSSRLL